MSIITKAEIAKQVSESIKSDLTNDQVSEVINNLLSKISENLVENEKVQFTGFGTFNAKNVPARIGRNPQTGQPLEISAKRQVTFSAGKELKEKVNS
jgi:nucleoid DNA-binding protein